MLLTVLCLTFAVSCTEKASDIEVPNGMKLASGESDIYCLFVPNSWTVKRGYDSSAAYYSATDTSNVVVTTYILPSDITVGTAAEDENDKADIMPDIYVNVSAGTSEYSAASLMASMMHEGVMPFNVSTEKYTVPPDMIREVYFNEGRPVGLSMSVKEPTLISTFTMKKPDQNQIKGLWVLRRRLVNKEPISAAAVIPELSELGIIRCVYANSRKPDQNTLMNYQRNFVDKWIHNGWAERTSKRMLRITPDGEAVLKMFMD